MDLQPNEQIIKVIHRPILVYSFGIAISLILILTPCVLMLWFFNLKVTIFGFQIFWLGKLFFWFCIVVGLFFGLRTLLNASGNKMIVTNQRIILSVRKGFFSQAIFKINFEKIRNINLVVEGLLPTIFRLGTLEFALVESQDILKFSNLSNAGQTQELIIQLQSSFENSGFDQADNYELIEMARKIRDKLGKDVFRRIAEE